MRDITIPEPVEMIVTERETLPDGKILEKPVTKKVPLYEFLEVEIWPDPYWRPKPASLDHLKALISLGIKFRDKPKPGVKVRLTDGEWEHLCNSATLTGRALAGPNAISIVKLMAAIVGAEHVEDPKPQLVEAG